ncbi:transcription termination/antitermination protein NusG [Agrobacterium vitis]|uniref:transcription termination/antitermination protein NusG n=1 Tax=Agrobacterium vitis TaxID=373 RepID=UPI0018D25D58|nr:transcription termination/antitermination NusG family protein [Agrobacterium vitis]
MMQHKTVAGVPVGMMVRGGNDRADRQARIGLLLRSTEIAHQRWFAARVMTGREKTVENQLGEFGVQALVPMRKGPDLRRRHRVIPGQMMPVIHGYVLIKLPLDGQVLAGLRAVDHFISLVGGFDNPLPLTEVEVMRFKALADDGTYDWERNTGKSFWRGERVQMYDGPFAGMKGEVVSCRSDGKGDVVVLVEMFGGIVPVTVPIAFCEKM